MTNSFLLTLTFSPFFKLVTTTFLELYVSLFQYFDDYEEFLTRKW